MATPDEAVYSSRPPEPDQQTRPPVRIQRVQAVSPNAVLVAWSKDESDTSSHDGIVLRYRPVKGLSDGLSVDKNVQGWYMKSTNADVL